MIARHEATAEKIDIWAQLSAPLPTGVIAWRQDGRAIQRDGKFFARFVAYVDANTVRERLDSVVAGEWDLTLGLLPTLVSDEQDEPTCSFKARLQILGVIREDLPAEQALLLARERRVNDRAGEPVLRQYARGLDHLGRSRRERRWFRNGRPYIERSVRIRLGLEICTCSIDRSENRNDKWIQPIRKASYIYLLPSSNYLVDAGISLEQVAALLGHESLNIVMIYTKPSHGDLEKAVRKAAGEILE